MHLCSRRKLPFYLRRCFWSTARSGCLPNSTPRICRHVFPLFRCESRNSGGSRLYSAGILPIFSFSVGGAEANLPFRLPHIYCGFLDCSQLSHKRTMNLREHLRNAYGLSASPLFHLRHSLPRSVLEFWPHPLSSTTAPGRISHLTTFRGFVCL